MMGPSGAFLEVEWSDELTNGDHAGTDWPERFWGWFGGWGVTEAP